MSGRIKIPFEKHYWLYRLTLFICFELSAFLVFSVESQHYSMIGDLFGILLAIVGFAPLTLHQELYFETDKNILVVQLRLIPDKILWRKDYEIEDYQSIVVVGDPDISMLRNFDLNQQPEFRLKRKDGNFDELPLYIASSRKIGKIRDMTRALSEITKLPLENDFGEEK